MKPEELSGCRLRLRRAAAGDKIYSWSTGIAGLRNRILCAQGAVLYARLSGRRFIIDWTRSALLIEWRITYFIAALRLHPVPPAMAFREPDSAWFLSPPVAWPRASRYGRQGSRTADRTRSRIQVRHAELSIDLVQFGLPGRGCGGSAVRRSGSISPESTSSGIHFRSWQRCHGGGHFGRAPPGVRALAACRRFSLASSILNTQLVLDHRWWAYTSVSQTTGFRIVAIIQHLNALLRRSATPRLFLATDNFFEITRDESYLTHLGVATTPIGYGESEATAFTIARRIRIVPKTQLKL